MAEQVKKEITSLEKIRDFGAIVLSTEDEIFDHAGYAGRMAGVIVPMEVQAANIGGSVTVSGSYEAVVAADGESIYDAMDIIYKARRGCTYMMVVIPDYVDVTVEHKGLGYTQLYIKFIRNTILDAVF
jgi:hypothetical protein